MARAPSQRLTAETAGTMGGGSDRNANHKDSRSHKRRDRDEGTSGKSRKAAASSSSRRKHRSSREKERSSTTGRNGGGGEGAGESEGKSEPVVDLIGWGPEPPAASPDPPLLLQDATGPGVAAPSPAAAPVSAGKAMRAPPSSLQGTWESDLSAILSAAAPIAANAPAPTADTAVALVVRPAGSGTAATKVPSETGGSIDGGMIGDGVGEEEGGGSTSRDSRRRSGEGTKNEHYN